MPKEKSLTVGKLKELLAMLPPQKDSYIVFSAGCDCAEEASGIDINDALKVVTLVRKD